MAAPMLQTALCRTRQIFVPFMQNLRKSMQRTTACTYHSDAIGSNREAGVKSPDTLLRFFNECDLVTLRKLILLDPALLHDLDPMQVLTRGSKSSKRFENIDSLQRMLQIEPKDVLALEMLTKQVNTSMKSAIIRGHPRITKKTMENVEKIVAVDLFLKHVAWSEQTMDRTVVSVGYKEVFDDIPFKHVRSILDFDHMLYQNKALEIVNMIPESRVYCIVSNVPQTKSMQSSRYHLTMLEALVITLLNSRHNQQLRRNREKVFQFTNNKVFMVNYRGFIDFYSVQFNNEFYKCGWMVEKALNNEPGPLTGISFSDTAAQRFKQEEGQGSITKCILLSDMVCGHYNYCD